MTAMFMHILSVALNHHSMMMMPDNDPVCIHNPSSLNLKLEGYLSLDHLGMSTCRDVWGYVSPIGQEYAIITCQASSARGSTSFIRVTNASEPIIIGQFGTADLGTWDVKTYSHYAFVISEDSNYGSIYAPLVIYDMNRIDQDIVQEIIPRSFETDSRRNTHNVAIDEQSAFLYRCIAGNGQGYGIYIYDLNRYMGSDWESIGHIDDECHDLQVKTINDSQYAFVATGNTHDVRIYDVTDKTNIVLMSKSSYDKPGYAHQVWVDEENQYLYMNDELWRFTDLSLTSQVFIFDIRNFSNIRYLKRQTNGEFAHTHNMFVKGNTMFQANYVTGLRIWNITDRENIDEIGYYDTHNSTATGFRGLWGTYPYLPSGNILGSDINCGLYIWSSPLSPPLNKINQNTYRSFMINSQESFSIVDVVSLVRHLLGKPMIGPVQITDCADYNKDNMIDITDIVSFLQYLLGKVGPAPHH